jgi:hypothetical protein
LAVTFARVTFLWVVFLSALKSPTVVGPFTTATPPFIPVLGAAI